MRWHDCKWSPSDDAVDRSLLLESRRQHQEWAAGPSPGDLASPPRCPIDAARDLRATKGDRGEMVYTRYCGKCKQQKPQSNFTMGSSWCRTCELLLTDPWLIRKALIATEPRPKTSASTHNLSTVAPRNGTTRDSCFLRRPRQMRIPGTALRLRTPHLRPVGDPRNERRRVPAAIERLRRQDDVQRVLRSAGAEASLPPQGDGRTPNPRWSIAPRTDTNTFSRTCRQLRPGICRGRNPFTQVPLETVDPPRNTHPHPQPESTPRQCLPNHESRPCRSP